jgi:hypothetical protein
VDGWVQLDQCYRGFDPVPDAELVYRYQAMLGLTTLSTRNIGGASVGEPSVELQDVKQGATLCTRAEVRILYPLWSAEIHAALATRPYSWCRPPRTG